MKRSFIVILSIQFVLNVLFLVYAIMAKNEADKATSHAITNEMEAIRQVRHSDSLRIVLEKQLIQLKQSK